MTNVSENKPPYIIVHHRGPSTCYHICITYDPQVVTSRCHFVISVFVTIGICQVWSCRPSLSCLLSFWSFIVIIRSGCLCLVTSASCLSSMWSCGCVLSLSNLVTCHFGFSKYESGIGVIYVAWKTKGDWKNLTRVIWGEGIAQPSYDPHIWLIFDWRERHEMSCLKDRGGLQGRLRFMYRCPRWFVIL